MTKYIVLALLTLVGNSAVAEWIEVVRSMPHEKWEYVQYYDPTTVKADVDAVQLTLKTVYANEIDYQWNATSKTVKVKERIDTLNISCSLHERVASSTTTFDEKLIVTMSRSIQRVDWKGQSRIEPTGTPRRIFFDKLCADGANASTNPHASEAGATLVTDAASAKMAPTHSDQSLSSPTSANTSTRRYAVLSLIGDSMGVVVYRGQTGTFIPTKHQLVPLPDPVFDKAALMAVSDAIGKTSDQSGTALLSPTPNLYAAQSELVTGTRFAANAELEGALKDQRATHLILITKHRGEAQLKTDRGSVGAGKLEGVGYYIDYSLKTRRSDTFESGTGFLAPYTYFKISLVDLATSSVIREHKVTEATMMSAARIKDGINPWDVLTPQQKIDALKSMIRREVTKAVPRLLSTDPS